MTFSMVAVDPDAGEVGFIIASCCWDAGQVCMAVAERGAIASQASGNIAFMEAFFEMLEEGRDLTQILAGFNDMDDDIQSRQIGMIDIGGRALAFTGNKCSHWAGQRTGLNYSCQGNILAGPEVIAAMARTFENTAGKLYERLYAALRTADEAGGDARGRQSARLVVKRKGAGPPGTDSVIDITIEDHDDPISEMGRILAVRKDLMQIMGYLTEVAEADGEEKHGILAELGFFMEDKKEPRYLDWWESLAMAYYEAGDTESAVRTFMTYFTIAPEMTHIFKENTKKGLFPEELARLIF